MTKAMGLEKKKTWMIELTNYIEGPNWGGHAGRGGDACYDEDKNLFKPVVLRN